MSKTFLSVCLILISICFVSSVYASPSLGASPYNPDETVNIDKRTSFAVGRIYNTGNETLMINAFYVQTACYGMNYTKLSVNVNPETKILPPNQTYKIHVTVEAKVIAKYEGYIQIKPSLANKEKGNPILNAPAFNFKVTTLNYTDSPLQTQKTETKHNTVNIPFLLFYVTIICFFAVGMLYWRKRKTPKTTKKKFIRLLAFFFLITIILTVPLALADESSDGTASVSTPTPKYYFNFVFQDLDANNVESYISWQLWNASQQLTYTEGQSTLVAGNYTLKTRYLGHQINQSILDTAIYGNSSFTVNAQMKSQLVSGRWIAFNNTVSSVTINSVSSTQLNFTATGSGTFLIVVATPNNCTHITKDGVNQTGWTYTTSPSKHVYLTSTLSTWVYYFSTAEEDIYDTMWDKLFSGDFVGFILAPYLNLVGNLFYGLVMLMICIPIYNRTKSITPILILFIIFGGGAGIFSLLVPEVGLGLGWILLLLGLGGLLYKVFR